MNNWTTYLTSRGYKDSENMRTTRFLSRALTFPLTISQFFLENPHLALTESGNEEFGGTRPATQSYCFLNLLFHLQVCVVGSPAVFRLASASSARVRKDLFPLVFGLS